MDTNIYAAFIGFFGIIIGAIIQACAGDIKELFFPKNINHKDLIGKWECTWHLENSEGRHPESVTDVLEIYKVQGSKIFGRAHTPKIGEWLLTGIIQKSNVLTYTFCGVDRDQLVGSGVAKLNIERNLFEGVWLQADQEGAIIIGSSTWKKV